VVVRICADVEPATNSFKTDDVEQRLFPPPRSHLCNVRVCIPVVIRSLTFFRGAVVEEKNTRSSPEINDHKTQPYHHAYTRFNLAITPTAMFIVVVD
jgi:hypothetical protein